jgi:hypothetical protein
VRWDFPESAQWTPTEFGRMLAGLMAHFYESYDVYDGEYYKNWLVFYSQ